MSTTILSENIFVWNPANTPMLAISCTSVLFNSVRNNMFRPSNFFSNAIIIGCLAFSNGFYGVIGEPVNGAKLGLAATALWMVGLPTHIFFTQRLMRPAVHYGIGTAAAAYHLSRWYADAIYYQDAGEDATDDDDY